MSKHIDGELTTIARNEIEYYEEDMEEIGNARLFRDGIVERICELGYADDKNDDAKIIDFVCEKFKEHNITIKKKDEDRTRVDVRNWVTGSVPNDSEQSRPNIYKLCFALEMDAGQTEVFFLKKYLCRPFNYKNADEAVYYFCLNTGRTYSKAEKLIEQINQLPLTPMEKNTETRLIEIPLSDIRSEEDFLSFMQNHRYDKAEQHRTVSTVIKELIEVCKDLSGTKSNTALLEAVLGYKERDIFVVDAKTGKQKDFGISKSDLPDAVKTNFPRMINFSQIKNGKATDDTYRKMLVILHFYKFYIKLKNEMLKAGASESNMDLSENSDEFEVSLDQLLEKCGYVQIYYRNPFDAFIMFCAKQKSPVEEMQYILKKYYVDVADGQ